MLRWLQFYINICLLKARPQDAPSSNTVFYMTVFAYWLSGVVLTSQNQTMLASIFIAIIQTVLVLFFINLSLWIRKYPERIVQTITAFTGSGLIISLIALPVILWFGNGGESVELLYTVFWIGLVVWETIIVANIFRHALDIPIYAAAGVSLVLMYMSFAITLRFLKLLSVDLVS